jgi:WD40 repeat protein
MSGTSKVVQFPITSQSREYYSIGQPRSKYHRWRPTGKMITTLYEHAHNHQAVNTLAVTDDYQYFATGCKNEGIVKVWKTREIEYDVTSHSMLTIAVPQR